LIRAFLSQAPVKILLDAHLPPRLCGRSELFLHGGDIRPAAGPDVRALNEDYQVVEMRVVIGKPEERVVDWKKSDFHRYVRMG
jgi:hypothetical protein